MCGRHVALRLALLALALGGCRYDVVLDANGGGTMQARYRVGKDGTVAKLKRSFLSPNIKIKNATLDKDKYASVHVAFDDVTKLSTARMFQQLKVTRTVGADGVVAIEARLPNKPTVVPPETLDYFGREVRLTITTPGEITDSNATSTAGRTATWTWPSEQLFAMRELELKLSYKGSAPGTAAPASPAPATPAAS